MKNLAGRNFAELYFYFSRYYYFYFSNGNLFCNKKAHPSGEVLRYRVDTGDMYKFFKLIPV